jgi:hypothetical protein
MTTTRLPSASDCPACSAWSRHTITVKNDAAGKLSRNVAAGVRPPKVQWAEMCFLDADQVEDFAEVIGPRWVGRCAEEVDQAVLQAGPGPCRPVRHPRG